MAESPHAERPASGTEGFFQQPPQLKNPFHDRSYRRLLKLFLPNKVKASLEPELAAFGQKALSPETLRLNQDAEVTPPRTEPLDSFGRPKGTLITSEGWRRLTAIHHQEGLVAIGYENRHGPYDRLHQFLKCSLWSPSSGGVTCPAAMQDGAASLLQRLLATDKVDNTTRPVLLSAYRRLTSREAGHAWTSGQWMTERPGGSDVRNTETRAILLSSPSRGVASDGSPLGPWSIDGFKWFSSATDADMSVILARTPSSPSVSLFFVPVRRIRPSANATESDLEYNGITIQRLKNKLGTRSLPTAELILTGTRAHLLGKEGQGVKEISTVLNITRIHNAVGAIASWSRALAVAAAFARVRSTGGRLLMDTPLHVRGLAAQRTQCHAYSLLTFFAVALLGVSEHPDAGGRSPCAAVPEEEADVARLLRLFVPVLKAETASRAIEGVRHCMEALGGVGYLENSEVELNLAKLLRDTSVLSIWEGTYDVMAMDVVRILKGGDAVGVLDALQRWVTNAHARWPRQREVVAKAKRLTVERLEEVLRAGLTGIEEVTYNARALVRHVAVIGTTVMMVEDAMMDDDKVAWEMVGRWIDDHLETREATERALGETHSKTEWDRRIVFDEKPRTPESKL